MKFTSVAAGLLAVLSLDAVAAAASTAQCSSYISYQIINLYKSGSVFSNPNNCAKDLGGLGYTAGFVKFSTKRGDLFQVVDAFKQTASYKGEFDAYYSTLEKYASKHSGSTQNLDGLCNVWYNATTNPDFYTLQAKVAQRLYEIPSHNYGSSLGVQYSLTYAVLYDTAIDNGLSGTANSLSDLILKTNNSFKKSATSDSGSTLKINGLKIDEMIWLKKFLSFRLAANGYGDQAHVNTYLYIIDSGEYNWNPSVKILDPSGKTKTIDCKAIL
ncbi:hypothetical protein H4S02_001061 [Coemansia sp. RSA 2611]|nr:hypothetical protein H4S02_001061 [Coemansia sp. RSA 2611]